MSEVLKKHQIEAALHAEKKAISSGKLKEDNPLDFTPPFRTLCEACRRGDLKVCQEAISEGVNINARDSFDYTPLILASLCGHFEVVQLLLESGALCERDTFQGERCLYNALNDRIRNLLLSYDYSKSTDPLQPFAAHVSSLLVSSNLKTSDITIQTHSGSFALHKFILAARSPYFKRKLENAPDTTSWKLPNSISSQSFETAIRFLYLSDITADVGDEEHEQEIFSGIDKISRHLEIEQLVEYILERGDKRLNRQRRTDEVNRGRNQFDSWFQSNVIKFAIIVDAKNAEKVKWDRNNSIFADVLLRADEETEEEQLPAELSPSERHEGNTFELRNGIPVGPISQGSRPPSRTRLPKKSTLFPAHRAMLIRSEFFSKMFSSAFREAQDTAYLQIVPVDCTPDVLQIVLSFLYTEQADIPLDLAIDVLFAADLLFVEKLKVKAATIISTLGNGTASVVESKNSIGETDIEDEIDIYDVIRAAWVTRVTRLEEFGARFIAYRLERFVEQEEFANLVVESAARIQQRQETDSIELIDDIRYYLSERFRLRMEDAGLEEMMEERGDDLPAQNGIKAINSGEIKIDTGSPREYDSSTKQSGRLFTGEIRTLDGDEAGDEFAQDALNYQILLGKIETLLARLNLDA